MLLQGGALPLAANEMICAPTQSPNGTTCISTGCNEMKPCDNNRNRSNREIAFDKLRQRIYQLHYFMATNAEKCAAP